MTNSKKQNKNLTQNKTKNKHADSSAGSILFDDLFGERFKELFGGKIVHMSWDCPENLRNAFVKLAKEKYGSACKTLQKLMAIFVLKSTLEKDAYGNTLSMLVDVPLRVGEVRFEQYVQSRPRRFGGSVAVLGGGNWYCALSDEHVPFESLPLAGCNGCPNGSCRRFVFGRLDGGFSG